MMMLRTLGLLLVAQAPPWGLYQMAHQKVESASNVYDVAVIGSGFAGLSAAIEASNVLPNDARILIIEKMPVPGGNSVMNAGQIAAVGSKAQKLDNIEDSVDLMMEDTMLKAGVNLNHPNLLRKLIEDSNGIVEWTEKEMGVQYRDRVTQL